MLGLTWGDPTSFRLVDLPRDSRKPEIAMVKRKSKDDSSITLVKKWFDAFHSHVYHLNGCEDQLKMEAARKLKEGYKGGFMERWNYENVQWLNKLAKELVVIQKPNTLQDLRLLTKDMALWATEEIGGEWLIFFDLLGAVISNDTEKSELLFHQAIYLLHTRAKQKLLPVLKTQNHKRDAFMYQKAKEGLPWKEIRLKVARVFDSCLSSDAAARQAVQRYISTNDLPPLPPRKKAKD